MGLRGPGARVPTVRVGGARRGRPPAWTHFDTRAERVIGFIEALTVTAGMHAGRPFRLRDWQKAIIQAWYATDASGRRIVRTGLLTLGRKNGKTSLCAALALAHLVGPEVERRGQVVAVARERDQASLMFDELSAFIRDTPRFMAETNIQRFTKIIEHKPSGTVFRVL